MGRIIYTMKNSVAFVALVVFVCCIFVVIVSIPKLPEVSQGNRVMDPHKEVAAGDGGPKLGKFGEMMVEMLPNDLAFTVFVPSERAFERDLRLVNDSSRNDTYAVVSRVVGFSAVARTFYSATVGLGEVVSYDSLSGLTLFISKDVEGMLVVNRVAAERVDIRRNKMVVHVMDGVLMDAEFEQSVQPDEDDNDG